MRGLPATIGTALLLRLRNINNWLVSFLQWGSKAIIVGFDIESDVDLGAVATSLRSWKITLKPLI